MVTVYLVDDHPLVVETLRSAIARRSGLECVGWSHDGRRAVDEVSALRPQVIVLDMRIPDFGGSEVLRSLAERALPTKGLVLSAYVDSAAVHEALSLGARGYLSKLSAADTVCDAILAVARGETVLPPQVRSALSTELQRQPGGGGPTLTEREREILIRLADGLSVPRIADELRLSPGTVRTHLQKMYGKLGVSNQAGAVAAGMRLKILS
jgi:two-component system, NarL family, nitrate/nitrite response regulator NarL